MKMVWLSAPDLGRWVSRDPIEEAGGLNLYKHCDNGVVNVTDPTGETARGNQRSDEGDSP
jgi:hypothetical protein